MTVKQTVAPLYAARGVDGALASGPVSFDDSRLTQAERFGMSAYLAELAGESERLLQERRTKIMRLCQLVTGASQEIGNRSA